MPRYIVERTFPDGLRIPRDEKGAESCRGVVERNADDGVTWIHSYVSDDATKTFCVMDGPSPEGDSQDRAAQRASRRPHHAGPCPRSVLLRMREDP
jgi:hypothetical protein